MALRPPTPIVFHPHAAAREHQGLPGFLPGVDQARANRHGGGFAIPAKGARKEAQPGDRLHALDLESEGARPVDRANQHAPCLVRDATDPAGPPEQRRLHRVPFTSTRGLECDERAHQMIQIASAVGNADPTPPRDAPRKGQRQPRKVREGDPSCRCHIDVAVREKRRIDPHGAVSPSTGAAAPGLLRWA